ncbi:MAG: FecR family protein [Spirochaetota bacterium]
MRRSGFSICLYILLALATITIFITCQKTVDKQMRIVFKMGDATFKSENRTQSPVYIKQILNKKDLLKTGENSFVIIQYGESILIRVQEKSSIEITSLFDASLTELSISEGKVLSAVHKLAKDERYRIKTPTTIAAVRGTEFSVSHYRNQSVVAVYRGNVQVSIQGARKEEKALSDGLRAVVDSGISTEPIKDPEAEELKQIADVPPLQGIGTKTEKEIIEYGEKYFKNTAETEKEKKDEGLMTLGQLRAKYGRIDEVTLYSGKIVIGVITKRGKDYTILTPKGEVVIPKTDINYTKEK